MQSHSSDRVIYAEANGVVLLAREVDRFDVLRHQRQIRLFLIMAVEVLELNLNLVGLGQLLVSLPGKRKGVMTVNLWLRRGRPTVVARSGAREGMVRWRSTIGGLGVFVPCFLSSTHLTFQIVHVGVGHVVGTSGRAKSWRVTVRLP